jgi:hypothetical protein
VGCFAALKQFRSIALESNSPWTEIESKECWITLINFIRIKLTIIANWIPSICLFITESIQLFD